MKKNLLLLFAVIFIQYNSNAQSSCGGRYQSPTFGVQTISNVVYGMNVDLQGDNDTLKMDIYLPNPDTSTSRPVLIFAHGGYFIAGDKTDGDVAGFAAYFASLGYVCISYNYRLLDISQLSMPLQQAALIAAYMAQQDARALNRFLRKDAANGNTYGIDPTQIFEGGVSAGAFNALNIGYLSNNDEIAAVGIDTVAYGGIEGNSGTPGFSSKAKGIVNLCGAMAQVSWIQNGNVPICSMHGTADAVVPFDYGWVSLSGINILQVYGSKAVDSACKAVGVESDFHAWIGAPHVPFDTSLAYFDSVLSFVTPFLFAHLTCNGFTGITNLPVTGKNIKVYPVPSQSEVTVAWNNVSHESFNAEVIDYSGRIVKTYGGLSGNTLLVSKGNLPNGIYLLKMQSGNDFRYGKIIFN